MVQLAMSWFLTGDGAAGQAEVHMKAFELAHNHFMHKTVHAGEDFGPESISQA